MKSPFSPSSHSTRPPTALENIENDCIHSMGGLLQLILCWSRQPMYEKVFGSGSPATEDDDSGENCSSLDGIINGEQCARNVQATMWNPWITRWRLTLIRKTSGPLGVVLFVWTQSDKLCCNLVTRDYWDIDFCDVSNKRLWVEKNCLITPLPDTYVTWERDDAAAFIN